MLKLVRRCDEQYKAAASGMDTRPTTSTEIVKHLADYGISEQLATRPIRWM